MILECADCRENYEKKPTDGLLVCRFCKGQIKPIDEAATIRRDGFEREMIEIAEFFDDDLVGRNKEFDRIIPLALTQIGDDERGFAYDRVNYILHKNNFRYEMEGGWDEG